MRIAREFGEKTHSSAFSGLGVDTAVQLKAISIRIQVRVNRVAEECIAIGRDYLEVKELLKKDGKLFVDWCNSTESAFAYRQVSRFMRIASEFAEKMPSTAFSRLGVQVLEQLAAAKDEVRDALLSHIETKQEKGETVTVKEIEALRRQLQEQKAELEASEQKAFDAKEQLQKAREALVDREQKLKDYREDAGNHLKERKELKAKIREMQDAIKLTEQPPPPRGRGRNLTTRARIGCNATVR